MSDFMQRLTQAPLERVDVFGMQADCPVSVEMPTAPSNIILLTGDNASKRSVLRRFLGSQAQKLAKHDGTQIQVRDADMANRTSTNGFQNAVAYLSEDDESVGRISVRFIEKMFQTTRHVEKPVLLILDKPDFGLSEGFQSAMGRYLIDTMEDMPGHVIGLVVATHSRPLARIIADHGAMLMQVGAGHRPTKEWLSETPAEESVESLLRLNGRAGDGSRALRQAISDGKPT